MDGTLCARLVNLEVRVYDLIHQVKGLVTGVVGRVLTHTLVFLRVVFEPDGKCTFYFFLKLFIITKDSFITQDRNENFRADKMRPLFQEVIVAFTSCTISKK